MGRIDSLRRRVVEGRGELDSSIRRAAYDDNSADLSPPLARFVGQVHNDAYAITDGDVDALRESLSEDQIFELTVAAATGAGLRRLDVAMSALRDG